MEIEVLRRAGFLTLFLIHFNNDDTDYPIWSIDEKHAIAEANAIANLLNTFFSPQLLNKNGA